MEKLIHDIDDLIQNTRPGMSGWVIAKPDSATGWLKWKIRFTMAYACLSGKAIAVTFKS